LPLHLKLLVFDLDYLLFDCSLLKANALRQSLVSFAEAIPHSVRLPDAADIEEAYRQEGFLWLKGLELGLDEQQMEDLAEAYRIHEGRLIDAGAGRIYPGLTELLAAWRRDDVRLAIGADATRDYLLSVCDRHALHGIFDVVLCTDEYGAGSAQEMLEDVMYRAEVNPSETLLLGTRQTMFEAAHTLDVVAVGCGWGTRQHDALAEADLNVREIGLLPAAVREADQSAFDFSG
jgi:phosphoglycolate phosphatase-like HAD superfamily hydrolase